jgi:ABC-type molybdate transport system substrate-binding protein
MDSYPALLQSGVILKWVKEPVGAKAFQDFLLSAPGQSILEHFGFIGEKSSSKR